MDLHTLIQLLHALAPVLLGIAEIIKAFRKHD